MIRIGYQPPAPRQSFCGKVMSTLSSAAQKISSLFSGVSQYFTAAGRAQIAYRKLQAERVEVQTHALRENAIYRRNFLNQAKDLLDCCK